MCVVLPQAAGGGGPRGRPAGHQPSDAGHVSRGLRQAPLLQSPGLLPHAFTFSPDAELQPLPSRRVKGAGGLDEDRGRKVSARQRSYREVLAGKPSTTVYFSATPTPVPPAPVSSGKEGRRS